jgi:hypothetical protein
MIRKKYTAYQEQAGLIITRWAKKSIESKKMHFKNDRKKKSADKE